MIRRRPSTTVVSFARACMLSWVRALARAFLARVIDFSLTWVSTRARRFSTSSRAYQTSSGVFSANSAMLVRYERHSGEHHDPPFGVGEADVAPGDGQARREPLDVPLEGAGQGLVEVVEVEHEAAVGRGEDAEVGQVGVAAELRPQPRVRRRGQVGRHGQGSAAEERERRDEHPAVADGEQLGDPRAALADDQPDGVTVRGVAQVGVALERRLLARRLARLAPFCRRGVEHAAPPPLVGRRVRPGSRAGQPSAASSASSASMTSDAGMRMLATSSPPPRRTAATNGAAQLFS